MIFSSLRNRLKDTSISRKLYFTVGIMALLVVLELSTLWLAITTLSAMRSYVEGEGLWSKAQKDAIYHLRIYATSHNENDYQAFRDFLKVPLGDKKALIQLSGASPDYVIARQGMLEGRNHPDDIEGMINLIKRFYHAHYIHNAFDIWEAAEGKMEQLIPLSDKMHQMISSGTASQQQINAVMSEVEVINIQLSKLEDDFSFTLGEGSRRLESLVLRLLLALSLTIGTTSIIITISVSRGIEKSIKAIIDGAAHVKQGELGTRVKVFSKDEIGLLATEFNQMTASLEHHIQELENAEESLTKERDRAEASEKVKQLFLANMSHEIRTPMNAILGFARLLEEAVTDKELHEYVQVIIRSGDDLLVILNDILDFSRIEAGKVNFEQAPFDLRGTITAIITMMHPKAVSKNLELRQIIDPMIPQIIKGDSVRLSQILLNLVSNAIKFSADSKIDIVVSIVENSQEGITLEFLVSDKGIGIPLEKQGKIFESFEQASTDTIRKFGGTGLGLSIAKQLVEMQGGRIAIKSEVGVGSDFYFQLTFIKNNTDEAGQEHIKTEAPADAADQNGKGLRVLVVEDNTVNQMLIIKVLQKRDFDIDLAENGLIALEKHKANDYDIILMDLQMPEMDGYQTTHKIRSMDSYKRDIPIMAMTAHTIKGEKERCLAIGMDDYVPKPFNVKELFEKMFALVNKDRSTNIDQHSELA